MKVVLSTLSPKKSILRRIYAVAGSTIKAPKRFNKEIKLYLYHQFDNTSDSDSYGSSLFQSREEGRARTACKENKRPTEPLCVQRMFQYGHSGVSCKTIGLFYSLNILCAVLVKTKTKYFGGLAAVRKIMTGKRIPLFSTHFQMMQSGQ